MHNIKRLQGFTLVELMIVVLVIGAVVVIAVPSFQNTILENRIKSQLNELGGHISFARSEATKRPGFMVTLCPSADGSSCSTGNWEGGWIIFLDKDGDRTVDSSDDSILRVVEGLSSGNTLRTSGFTNSTFIQFASSGRPTEAGALSASSGTLTLCDLRGASSARALVVMSSGQVRLARDENNDGVANNHGGDNITCP